jgi:2-polyprenyl-3-methyl-5-hydroxy-6-metoxy-1,4-benzoquinol methylase
MLGVLKRQLRTMPGLAAVARRLDQATGLRNRGVMTRAQTIDRVALSEFVPAMLRYWKEDLHVSEDTARDWLRTALDYTRYEHDVTEITKRFGSLAGRRVLDVGCGWGSFLVLLAREDANVDACDVPAIHVEVAQRRVPDARVVRGDARSLTPFPDATFDVVLEHDVFEHVGDYEGQTGPMGPSRPDKLQNLLALKRVLKPGGRGFISTGNYGFPFNGEVGLWAVHWFPFAHQQRYLRSVGLDSDRYWLCTWKEIQDLFEEAGLIIEEVTTPAAAARDFRNRIMSCLKHERGANAEFADILLELMSTQPEFMPSWMIFFRKPS